MYIPLGLLHSINGSLSWPLLRKENIQNLWRNTEALLCLPRAWESLSVILELAHSCAQLFDDKTFCHCFLVALLLLACVSALDLLSKPALHTLTIMCVDSELPATNTFPPPPPPCLIQDQQETSLVGS